MFTISLLLLLYLQVPIITQYATSLFKSREKQNYRIKNMCQLLIARRGTSDQRLAVLSAEKLTIYTVLLSQGSTEHGIIYKIIFHPKQLSPSIIKRVCERRVISRTWTNKQYPRVSCVCVSRTRTHTHTWEENLQLQSTAMCRVMKYI